LVIVVTGPMFSGKSTFLTTHARGAADRGAKVQAFKHAFDTRYGDKAIATHSGDRLSCTLARTPNEILRQMKEGTTKVVIDEAQFFDAGIVRVVQYLVELGIDVTLGGLDLDYRGEPFGPMPALMSIADDVIKVTGICAKCGAPSTRTQRMVTDDSTVLVGGEHEYSPRCLECWHITPAAPVV
jgi:thymidine kinase